MEFVGKAIWTNLNGIRGQGNFGPTLMEFVGKAIWTNLNGIRGQGNFSDQP